jgi:hypothetical protein
VTRRPAAAVFAALLLATVGALVAAQRLRAASATIADFARTPVFSPNGDGRLERAGVRFRLARADRVTVAVVDAGGAAVRTLVRGRTVAAGREVRAAWDGRDDAGTRARDGRYRYRITLQRQGRNTIVPRVVDLDTTPPDVRVLDTGPQPGPVAELLPEPDGTEAVVRLRAPGTARRVLLFKMAPGAPRLVQSQALPDNATEWRWDGGLRNGRPAATGIYLAAVQARDRAGNLGTSPALGRDGLPATTYGTALPGRGGIAVRYLAVQPSLRPARAGGPFELRVDARGRPWRWSVWRLGGGRVRRGVSRTPRLRLTAPGPDSGVYLLDVGRGRYRVRTPFAVQGRDRRPVLVVLPAITWQGRNLVDDDGDGLPNVLDRGLPARLGRVFAGDGLPAGFAQREAPLLSWLTRTRRRFDVTTDAALALRHGPPLEGHRGVLLPSDTRWLPRTLQERLQRFVRSGGTVLSLGVDSLRREVEISPDGRLLDPTPPAAADLFGARLDPLLRRAAPVTLTQATDQIDLFAGTDGQFGGWHRLESLGAAGPGHRLVASAVGDGVRPAISAIRYGRGLVLRFGLPELPRALQRDETDPTTALMIRAWTLLSR